MKSSKKFQHLDLFQVPDLKTQEIYGKRHYITPEGEKYPSITTVLGAEDKPWLENWRTVLGPAKADAETKRCAQRGTEMHEMIEMFLSNKEFDERTYKRENVQMFNQMKPYLNKINNIMCLETPLYSDTLKVAGRVDCIAEYDGIPCVIDFKTSNKAKTADQISGYKKQAAFYACAFNEMFDQDVDDYAIMISVERVIVPMVFRGKVDDELAGLIKQVKFYRNKYHLGPLLTGKDK